MTVPIRSELHVIETWLTMSSDPRALSALSSADYEAIELAVMETARGRWFLKEFARRNRTADTEVLLGAMVRLESAVTGPRALEPVERVRADLIEMSKSIGALKAELEQPTANHSSFDDAANVLDTIGSTTEEATTRILGATEQMQEIAWSLREGQVDSTICDRVDQLAADIYTACTVQDVTAQRVRKLIRTLRFLDGRINGLIDGWISQNSEHPVGTKSVDRFALMHADGGDTTSGFMPGADASGFRRPSPALDLSQVEAGDDLMVSDDDPIIIDDLDTLELELVRSEDDVVEDKTNRPPVQAAATSGPSLSQIDAMSTTAKALIFG